MKNEQKKQKTKKQRRAMENMRRKRNQEFKTYISQNPAHSLCFRLKFEVLVGLPTSDSPKSSVVLHPKNIALWCV